MLLPVGGLPGPVATVAGLLPSGALGELARAATLAGALPLGPVVVLLVWGMTAAALVVRTFRWS